MTLNTSGNSQQSVSDDQALSDLRLEGQAFNFGWPSRLEEFTAQVGILASLHQEGERLRSLQSDFYKSLPGLCVARTPHSLGSAHHCVPPLEKRTLANGDVLDVPFVAVKLIITSLTKTPSSIFGRVTFKPLGGEVDCQLSPQPSFPVEINIRVSKVDGTGITLRAVASGVEAARLVTVINTRSKIFLAEKFSVNNVRLSFKEGFEPQSQNNCDLYLELIEDLQTTLNESKKRAPLGVGDKWSCLEAEKGKFLEISNRRAAVQAAIDGHPLTGSLTTSWMKWPAEFAPVVKKLGDAIRGFRLSGDGGQKAAAVTNAITAAVKAIEPGIQIFRISYFLCLLIQASWERKDFEGLDFYLERLTADTLRARGAISGGFLFAAKGGSSGQRRLSIPDQVAHCLRASFASSESGSVTADEFSSIPPNSRSPAMRFSLAQGVRGVETKLLEFHLTNFERAADCIYLETKEGRSISAQLKGDLLKALQAGEGLPTADDLCEIDDFIAVDLYRQRLISILNDSSIRNCYDEVEWLLHCGIEESFRLLPDRMKFKELPRDQTDSLPRPTLRQ